MKQNTSKMNEEDLLENESNKFSINNANFIFD